MEADGCSLMLKISIRKWTNRQKVIDFLSIFALNIIFNIHKKFSFDKFKIQYKEYCNPREFMKYIQCNVMI